MTPGIQISGNSLDSLLVNCLRTINDIGHRGDKASSELLGVQVHLTNPRNIWMVNPERKHNPIAQIAEVIWVLAGSNSVDWLSKFLPRAIDFSDDGKTWRGGYGPRLFNATGVDDNGNNVITNQLDYIIKSLRERQSSRQALFTIWDPSKENTVGSSKDYPCNIAFQFVIRDNKLYLLSYVRSNDVIWGMSGTNLILWSFLLQTIASILDVEVGSYIHNVGSLHYYDYHKDRADKILEGASKLLVNNPDDVHYNSLRIKSLDIFKDLFEYELGLRSSDNGIVETSINNIINLLKTGSDDKYSEDAKFTLVIPLLHGHEGLKTRVLQLYNRDYILSKLHPSLAKSLVDKQYL